MIDGNISMEEDTELRDLVVQTLENNGILAKVRAELRASVFLTLEEQESVLNPEPFLNKPVKQYLASSEGKLLFSLVREFLEYFGLDYTISVYDPETYFGKEYNYMGRKKLCEELGINSREPLLGEILKNVINGALNNTQKNESSIMKKDKTFENLGNATFDISVPNILQKESTSISNDASENLDSVTNSNVEIPINVTIRDKKFNEHSVTSEMAYSPVHEMFQSLSDEIEGNSLQNIKDKNISDKNNEVTHHTDLNVNHSNKSITTQLEIHQNEETCKNKKTATEFQMINNVKNKKQIDPITNTGKTIYFDEIIVDGMKEKITGNRDGELLLGELPPLPSTNNSVFGDLPPLNGKKADMNDLKELIDIAQGVSQYEEDSASSASGNANEPSPSKIPISSNSYNQIQRQTNKQEFVENIKSENDSEEIDEEIPSSISCLENVVEKNTKNLTATITTNFIE